MPKTTSPKLEGTLDRVLIGSFGHIELLALPEAIFRILHHIGYFSKASFSIVKKKLIQPQVPPQVQNLESKICTLFKKMYFHEALIFYKLPCLFDVFIYRKLARLLLIPRQKPKAK